MQCRECNGTGVELIDCEHDDIATDTCWACNNTDGKIETECTYCDGYGTVSVCEECNGDGCDDCDYNGVIPAA